MKNDYVMDAVFEFLENGGDLPEDANKNPQSRFKFQSAMAKMTYQKSCLAIAESKTASEMAHATSDNMDSYKIVVDTKFEALVDTVDVRIGRLGGIIVLANGALLVLVKLLWP